MFAKLRVSPAAVAVVSAAVVSVTNLAPKYRAPIQSDLRLDALKPEDGLEEAVKALYQVSVPDRTFGDQYVTSAAASVSMASRKSAYVMSREEALTRIKRKRGDGSQGGSVDTTVQQIEESPSNTLSNREVPIPSRIHRTRSNAPVDPVVIPDTYDASFPTDFLADEGTVRDQLVLQDLQNVLYSKSHMEEIERKLQRAEKVRRDMQIQRDASNQKKDLNTAMEEQRKKFEEYMKKREEDMQEKEKNLMKKEEEMTELHAKIVDLEDDNRNIEAMATLKIKAYMANGFLMSKYVGEPGKKKLRQLVDEYMIVGHIRDLAPEDAKADELDPEKSTAETSPGHDADVPAKEAEEGKRVLKLSLGSLFLCLLLP
uniref:Uncharacterized protein n=1 Tax=Chenopodium quinoa TaxID=63459 RepID=A0A803L267_CHEQI